MDSRVDITAKAPDREQRSALEKATTGGAPPAGDQKEEERSEGDIGFVTKDSPSKPTSPKKLQSYKTVSQQVVVGYKEVLPERAQRERSHCKELNISGFDSHSDAQAAESYLTFNSKTSMIQNDTTKDIRSHASRNTRVHPIDNLNDRR